MEAASSSKTLELFTNQQAVVSKKTSIFTTVVVRASNPDNALKLQCRFYCQQLNAAILSCRKTKNTSTLDFYLTKVIIMPPGVTRYVSHTYLQTFRRNHLQGRGEYRGQSVIWVRSKRLEAVTTTSNHVLVNGCTAEIFVMHRL